MPIIPRPAGNKQNGAIINRPKPGMRRMDWVVTKGLPESFSSLGIL